MRPAAKARASVCLMAPVSDREDYFGVFYRHRRERAQPHPEYRARAADVYSRRDTGDISDAEGPGERDQHCAKRRHTGMSARVIIFEQCAQRDDRMQQDERLQVYNQKHPAEKHCKRKSGTGYATVYYIEQVPHN